MTTNFSSVNRLFANVMLSSCLRLWSRSRRIHQVITQACLNKAVDDVIKLSLEKTSSRAPHWCISRGRSKLLYVLWTPAQSSLAARVVTLAMNESASSMVAGGGSCSGTGCARGRDMDAYQSVKLCKLLSNPAQVPILEKASRALDRSAGYSMLQILRGQLVESLP